MKKYCLGNHPEIIITDLPKANFFGAGGKFDLPNLEDKLKEVIREDGRIVAKGAGPTRCSITAPGRMLDAIQTLLGNNIGIPLNKIGDLEFVEG